MQPEKLKILFAGSGEFGLPTLEALHRHHEILRVYTQPDRPAGRGRKLTPTPIAAYARRNALPLTETDNLSAESVPPADLLVVIAFGQKISERLAHHPRLGAINLHASLLPKYRGAAPIHHALINSERLVGNSVIRLARRMDAGAILGQAELQVRDGETTGELHDRLAADGAPLLLRVLQELAAGTAVERKQDDSQATPAPKLSRADTLLDFTRPAADIAARINGLSPWPGCHVYLMDGEHELDRLVLLRARPAPGAGSSQPSSPGQLATPVQSGRPALIAVADGMQFVEVLEVQPRARRAMPLSSYANGHPWRPGMRLTSA